jgi:hypothetical protein
MNRRERQSPPFVELSSPTPERDIRGPVSMEAGPFWLSDPHTRRGAERPEGDPTPYV